MTTAHFTEIADPPRHPPFTPLDGLLRLQLPRQSRLERTLPWILVLVLAATSTVAAMTWAA